MTTKTVRVCDICGAVGARRKVVSCGVYFDGHRNEENDLYVDLCSCCHRLISKYADAISKKRDGDVVFIECFRLASEAFLLGRSQGDSDLLRSLNMMCNNALELGHCSEHDCHDCQIRKIRCRAETKSNSSRL